MTHGLVAITGATGYLGGNVARKLSDRGMPLRLLVRDTARAPLLAGAGIAQADYFDMDAMRTALDGVDTLFFVSSNALHRRVEGHANVVRAAREAGVGRVVYTSFLGAGPEAIFTLSADHWQTERLLQESGLPYTALRNAFYAEIAEEMVSGGVIRGPGGDGRLAPVSRDDVVDTIVGVLATDMPPEGPVDVTGPQALSLEQLAHTYAEVTRQPASYVQETIEQARASRRHLNPSPAELEAWISTYLAIAAGELSAVTDTVERYAGHAPESFAEYLQRTGKSRAS